MYYDDYMNCMPTYITDGDELMISKTDYDHQEASDDDNDDHGDDHNSDDKNDTLMMMMTTMIMKILLV